METLKTGIKEAILIIAIAIPLALAINMLRKDGIPLFPVPKPEPIEVSAIPSKPIKPELISIEIASQKFHEKKALFIDARSCEDYRAGHISGAINLPFHEFSHYFPNVMPLLEKAEAIIAYCDGTDCSLGHDLTNLLSEMGFEHIFYLGNGLTEWIGHGLPLEKEDANKQS
ncbi:MAG: rhodanese-like domain-containing protein [Pseudomonadota bacterium]